MGAKPPYQVESTAVVGNSAIHLVIEESLYIKIKYRTETWAYKCSQCSCPRRLLCEKWTDQCSTLL